jgi:Tfp pilus assembly protein PilF
MLEKEPNDVFLLYGIAMEHRKLADYSKALEYLSRVIALDPGYCYAYHQRGMIFEAMGDMQSARKAYREGIEAAKAKGDAHAQEELQAALELIQ